MFVLSFSCTINLVTVIIIIKLYCGYNLASKIMYSQNPKVRDAQNPYKTGVLVGNYTEDKFGIYHAENPVSDPPYDTVLTVFVY